jgi:hypothetical protein
MTPNVSFAITQYRVIYDVTEHRRGAAQYFFVGASVVSLSATIRESSAPNTVESSAYMS